MKLKNMVTGEIRNTVESEELKRLKEKGFKVLKVAEC